MDKKIRFFIIDIILIPFIFIYMLNSLTATYLKEVIVRQVDTNTKGEYRLIIKKLDLNLLTGSMEAAGFAFEPRDPLSSSMRSSLISIENIDIADLFFHDKINIGLIRVNNSTIIVKADPKHEDDSTNERSDSAPFMFYDIFKDKYQSVFIHEIAIDNPTVKFFKNKNDTSFLISSRHGSIRMINLLIDSNTVFTQKRSFNADSLDIILKNVKNIVGDSLYTLNIPTLSLSYTHNKIFIDSLQLLPNYNKKEFSEAAGSQTDRFIIFSRSISIDSVDVKKLIEKLVCNAATINIDSLNVSAYRNKYITRHREKKKFLQELISEMGFPMRINRINIKNSYVEYEELVPPSRIPGKIVFTEIDASLDKISNYKSDKNQEMILHATAKLNNESPVDTRVIFPMDRIYFKGTGKVRKITMSNLNSMLEGTSGATITGGIIDSMKFTISSDTNISRGQLQMIYHDLRVAAKDIEHNDTSKLTLRIKSFLVNQFIIKKNNPEKGKAIRNVEMIHQYNYERFIINNLWKTMLVGVQKSIGVPVKVDKDN